MRIAAAAIGGAGAALGALFYLSAALLWVAIVLLSGMSPTGLVDLAFLGTLAAAVASCAAGAAGAWLVFGRRARRGAVLMLVAALGVAAAMVAHPFLVDAAGDRGLPERIRNDSEPSLADQTLLASLAPAGALLAGAAMALLPDGGTPRGPSGRARPGVAGRE